MVYNLAAMYSCSLFWTVFSLAHDRAAVPIGSCNARDTRKLRHLVGAFFFNGPGRSRDAIDGPGPTGLARGKRTVTVIAYRLFHSPAKDLRYSAAGSYKMRKCEGAKVRRRESAKVNMYKMRKFDAKDFAFYTSASWVIFSHFRIIRKMRDFINADPQSANYQTFRFLLFCCSFN